MADFSNTSICEKTTPKINNISFQAVISEGAELSASSTDYPVEDGSINQDHIVTNPLKLTMTIASSNTPITPTMLDIARDTSLGVIGSAASEAAALASLAASGYSRFGQSDSSTDSAGSNGSICAQLWDDLYKMMLGKKVFDVVHSIKVYKNMHFTSMSYQRTEEDENSIVILTEMKQITTTETRIAGGAENQIITTAGNVEAVQAQKKMNMGFLSKSLQSIGL